MKFSMSNPPSADAGLEATAAWLYELYEMLSAVLENIDRDNFGKDVKDTLDNLSSKK